MFLSIEINLYIIRQIQVTLPPSNQKTVAIFVERKNLVEITKSCKRNPRIAYLNINSLRNKIRLKEITKSTARNFVSLNENFPDSEFNLENYQFTPI